MGSLRPSKTKAADVVKMYLQSGFTPSAILYVYVVL